MRDITHCHNQRPIYRKENRDIFQWNSFKEVEGETKNLNYNNYHPFIIDIETSAELGQRPILLVGYDSLEKRLIILYSYGYQNYTISRSKVKELAENIDYRSLIVDNLSQSKFENYVLDPIHSWNKKAEERYDNDRKSLVAHNAEFDIPMLGTPEDKLLDHPKIGNQYEQAVSYKNIKMLGHRAGAFGNLFTFLDYSDDFQNLKIPVGDTLVVSKSLRIPASLKNACEYMDVDLNVSESNEHGNLNDNYVKYCINDVEATFQLYNKLKYRIKEMFGNLPLERIYSTASIGKYVLRKMNYKRVGYSQDAVDRIVPAYFGGRTDANITGEIIDDLRYTDILSEYPTVSKLTNVWEYMQAEKVDIKKIDKDDLPEIKNLKNPDNWKEISDYYVKIKPNNATLPIRTPHLDDSTKVVTAKVTSENDLTYHYMDIIASKLIDKENDIEIKSAWKVYNKGKQNLENTEIADVKIHSDDNVMAKGIESRKEIQKEEGKNSKTNSLKIVSNSLYGISAERIVDEIDDERQDIATKNGFYNPHVATTITAGGRLMLAFGEYIANKNGGDLIYCDTDSLIIPDSVTDEVINAYNNLNPYDGYAGTLDVLEDEKEKIGKLYSVGPKKYIFFNNDEILEFKEHGLGNYENIRNSEKIKKLWATIIKYDKGFNPLPIDTLYEYQLNQNVIWSFNASTRSMRKMVDEMTDDFIRYGDWLESTISYDNKIRYIALNLTEKSENEFVTKVKENEDTVEIDKIKVKEMNNSELKIVRDVVKKFVMDSANENKIPEVKVTDLKIVTKEATNRKDIFMTKLEQEFKNNMGNITLLFE